MQFVSGMFSAVKHRSLALLSGGRYTGEEQPCGHGTRNQIPMAYFGFKISNCICLIWKMMPVDNICYLLSLFRWFSCHDDQKHTKTFFRGLWSIVHTLFLKF